MRAGAGILVRVFGLDLELISSILLALAGFGGLSGLAAVIAAWTGRRRDYNDWVETARVKLREELQEDVVRVRQAYRSLKDDYIVLDRKHFQLSIEHDELQRAHARLKAEYDDLQAAYERLRAEHASLQADLDSQKQLAAELRGYSAGNS